MKSFLNRFLFCLFVTSTGLALPAFGQGVVGSGNDWILVTENVAGELVLGTRGAKDVRIATDQGGSATGWKIDGTTGNLDPIAGTEAIGTSGVSFADDVTVGGDILPVTDGGTNFGSTTKPLGDIYLANTKGLWIENAGGTAARTVTVSAGTNLLFGGTWPTDNYYDSGNRHIFRTAASATVLTVASTGNITTTGEVSLAGATTSGGALCTKADGNIGQCTTTVGAGGGCTCS